MHPFEHTISILGPFVGAIIVLTLFFKLIGWIGRRFGGRATRIALKGIFDERTLVTIHLRNGETLENVHIVGFTDSASCKPRLPYELHGMLVLSHLDGRRTLVRARLVRKIEVPIGGV